MTQPLQALRELAGGRQAWLVGGSVRDRLIGRATEDYDVVVREGAAELARELARHTRAHPFQLSGTFGAWRVVARDQSWQVDVLPLAGGGIESDLTARDLTINALAEPLGGGELLDPFGGRGDLEHRRLRMISPQAFEADPLRVVRLARLACELGFEPEAETEAAAARAAPGLAGVAGERVFAELKRILAADEAVAGLVGLERVGAGAVVLPELVRLRGVEQSHYHHLDVHDHTFEVLAEVVALTRDPGAAFGPEGPALRAHLDEPLADGLSRGQALRWGALLHDIAKPQTRGVLAGGRVTFTGHDEQGAEQAADILRRLRASQRLAAHVAALVRHHLRLGFLVHRMPVDERDVYRYLRATEPVEVDVTLLSVADRLATRGHRSEEAIDRHLELAWHLIGPALRWRQARPAPPVRGDELARALGLPPGPELGRVLAELEEAAYAGAVSGPAEAIALARELLGQGEPGQPAR